MIEAFKTVQFWAKAAAGDRKGATAVEYALIAAAAAALIGVGFRAFYSTLSAFVGAIVIA